MRGVFLCAVALLYAALALFAAGSVGAAGGLRPHIPFHWSLTPGSLSTDARNDTVPGSNNIVDIVHSGDYVWAATGRGLSRYSIADKTWRIFGKADQLGGDEIPSVQIFGSEVWVSTSHSQVIQDQSVAFGDGLFMSTNGGDTWDDVSPDSGQASGPFMLAYDIGRLRAATVAACFAGGLVMTIDGGTTWKNIFPDVAAQIDFQQRSFLDLNNRFFALVVDSTVPESLSLFAGTAAGVNRFVYLDSTLKVTGFHFRHLVLDGNQLLASTDRGLSRTPDRGGSWRTFYHSNGLPADLVNAAFAHGDTIIIGADSAEGIGAGLAYSYNAGRTWIVKELAQTLGANRRAVSVVSAAGAWWAACEQGGLIRSADNGTSWENIFADSGLAEDFRTNNPPALRNRVNALLPVTAGDTTDLYAGTDNGIIVYRVPRGQMPLVARAFVVGVPVDSLGPRVIRLGWQPRQDSSAILWSLHRPSQDGDSSAHSGFAVSADTARTWRVALNTLAGNDVAFFGSAFYMATDSGLAFSAYPRIDTVGFLTSLNSRVGDRQKPRITSVAVQVVPNSAGVDSLAGIWVASDSGLALSRNGGSSWAVVFSNPDPYEFDLRYQSTYSPVDSNGVFPSLSGNFITALGLQQYAGRRTIWAATQATASGQRNGISRSDNSGASWTAPITGHNVWNFAFDGAGVWAASSQGLLFSPDAGTTWDTLRGFTDPVSGAQIDSAAEIFGVEVVGSEIWIGTDNGLARLDKSDHHVLSVRRTFASVDSVDATIHAGQGGVYATPVPFSPHFHDGVRFHFVPPVAGKVTITIYDFANNVVRVLNGDRDLPAGVQSDESVVWDGKNGKGATVAVGTYFFIIEYANGATHWGKLAVIP